MFKFAGSIVAWFADFWEVVDHFVFDFIDFAFDLVCDFEVDFGDGEFWDLVEEGCGFEFGEGGGVGEEGFVVAVFDAVEAECGVDGELLFELVVLLDHVECGDRGG